jgi:vitamin B12 transporter
VVTATRTSQDSASAITPTIVIDRETIAASGAHDVVELLRVHAGVEVARNGGPGQVASVFLRGADSNHTLVLLDGVKLNPGTIGAAALQNIDPAIVERIEIVKGPRSAQYGSEAIGGVIQIFTRRDDDGVRVAASTGAGSDDTGSVSARFHATGPALSAGLDVSSLRTDGFPSRTDSRLDRGFDNGSINAYASAPLGAFEARLSHWQARGTVEYFDFALTPVDQDFFNAVTAATVSGPLNDRWATTLRVSRMHDEIDQNQSADFAHTRRTVLDWQNDGQIGQAHLLSAGLTHSQEDVTAGSFGTVVDENTRVSSVYLQDQFEHGRHQAVGALRHVDHEAFGGHTTGEVGYRFDFDAAWSAHASAGTGFRAPDATDRFGFGGNPDLDPETSRSIELGASFHPGAHLELRLTAFHNELNDLIVFTDADGFTGPAPGRNENVEHARNLGLELSLRLVRAPWELAAEAVIQDPENRDTGRQLPRRARETATASLTRTAGTWRFGLDAVAVGERPDSDFSDAVIPGYAVVNLRADGAVTRGWRIGVRIDNLFDRDYTEADGFNTRDRAAFVELRYTREARAGRA